MTVAEDESDNPVELDYDTYLSHRTVLIDTARESTRSFDKTAITVASGALALSVGFISDVVDSMEWQCLLWVSWFALILSILAILVSFLTSRKALNCRIDEWDDKFHNRKSSNRSECWSQATSTLNLAAIGLLVLGIIGLVLFAGINLPDQIEGEVHEQTIES